MAPAPGTNMGPARPKRNRRNLIIGGVAGLLVLAGIGNAIGGEEVRGRETTPSATLATAEAAAASAPVTTEDVDPLADLAEWVERVQDGEATLAGGVLTITYPFVDTADVSAGLESAASKAVGILNKVAGSDVEYETLHLAAVSADGTEAVGGDFAREKVARGISASEVWTLTTAGAPVYSATVQGAVDAVAAAEAEAAAQAQAEADAAAAEEAAAEAARLDPASYAEISARDWELLARDANAHLGERYQIYGMVTQFDYATGTTSFRADTGGDQARWYDYDINTFFSIEHDPALGNNLITDDLFVAYVEVYGSMEYDTAIGGTATAVVVQPHIIEVTGTR